MQATPPPTATSRSKNGPHHYWLLNETPDEETCVGLRWAAAIHHRADPSVAKAKPWLRLPGFRHQKDADAPFEVKLVEHEPSRVFTIDELAKAWGEIPSRSRRDEYKLWYNARKTIDQDAIGDWDSETWGKHHKSVEAYMAVKPVVEKVTAKLGMKLPDGSFEWDAAHGPKYWWGWKTWVHLAQNTRLHGVAGKQRHTTEYDPRSPEWLLEIEPKARFWLACIERNKRLAKGKARPLIEPFDVEKISKDEAFHAPEWKTIKRTGIPLRHLDIIGLAKQVGIYRREEGEGKHTIRCPWADQHTDSTKDEAAVWEPMEGRPAAYNCFHSHGGTIHDLLEHVGMDVAADFVSGAELGTLGAGQAYGHPKWTVTYPADSKKEGLPVPHRIENTQAMLHHHWISIRTNLLEKRTEVSVEPGLLLIRVER